MASSTRMMLLLFRFLGMVPKVAWAAVSFDPLQYLCPLAGQQSSSTSSSSSSNCTDCQSVCDNNCYQNYSSCGPALTLTTCQAIQTACENDCQQQEELCQLVSNLPQTLNTSAVSLSSFPADTCPELEIISACQGTQLEGLLEGSYIPIPVPTACQSADDDGLTATLDGTTPLYRSWWPDSLDESAQQFRYTYLYKTGTVQWSFRKNVIQVCDPPRANTNDTTPLLEGTGTFVASPRQPQLSAASTIRCSGSTVNGISFVENAPFQICCLTSGQGNVDTCINTVSSSGGAPAPSFGGSPSSPSTATFIATGPTRSPVSASLSSSSKTVSSSSSGTTPRTDRFGTTVVVASMVGAAALALANMLP